MSKEERKEERIEEEALKESAVPVEQETPLEDKIAELEAELTRLAGEFTQEKDTLLRKLADMDNYRKRLIKDKEQAIRFANEQLLRDLIPVLDSFDQAIAVSDQVQDSSSYKEGLQLIRKQLADVLERNWGLKAMENIVGKEFCPHEHEALIMEEGSHYKKDTILAELQKGYYLHDKVLKPAKVKVGKSRSHTEQEKKQETDVT